MDSWWPAGDGSTLSLDFTTGVLDPRLTFTRSTSGTYIGSDGMVKTATANTPRFDYDPTAIGTPRGLLIEGSANNLQPYSEDLSQTGTWAQQALAGITTNASGITDPAGGTSASKIRSNSAIATSHLVYSTRSTVSGTAYTMSAWVRAAEYNFAALHFASGTNRYTVVFNLTTGEVTQTNTYGSPTGTGQNAVKFGNWWRLSVTMNAADTTSYPHICLSPTGTPSVNSFGQPAFTGTAESGVYVWGAQLETGSGASSYIPTGSSTVSRAADECSMTGTNFSSWFNATEGAFLAHARRMRTTDVGRIASANDNTANESIDIGASTTGQFIVTDGGSALATITPGTVTANTAFKIAGAFKLNDVQAALGGTLGTPDTGVTMPTVNQLMIGRQAGGSPVYLNGTVSLLKFWPARLPDAQLQSLTT